MKRLSIFLAVAMLLLAGCTKKEPEENPSESTPQSTEAADEKYPDQINIEDFCDLLADVSALPDQDAVDYQSTVEGNTCTIDPSDLVAATQIGTVGSSFTRLTLKSGLAEMPLPQYEGSGFAEDFINNENTGIFAADPECLFRCANTNTGVSDFTAGMYSARFIAYVGWLEVDQTMSIAISGGTESEAESHRQEALDAFGLYLQSVLDEVQRTS